MKLKVFLIHVIYAQRLRRTKFFAIYSINVAIFKYEFTRPIHFQAYEGVFACLAALANVFTFGGIMQSGIHHKRVYA